MKKQFDIARQNRKVLRSILKKTPAEMLVKVPEGYRNNLWWNLAHIVATHQILVYRWSGVPTRVDEAFIDAYRKGTVPSEEPSQHSIDQLLDLLPQTIDWAEEDYEKGLFQKYQEYTTSVKVTLSSVEDAINFNNYHEGIHLGVILSQLKSLGIKIF